MSRFNIDCYRYAYRDPRISKLDGFKLFRGEPKNGVNSLIANAGNFAYGRMAMQHLQRDFADLKPNELGLSSIRDRVEQEMTEMYELHIYRHPDRSYGAIQFDLLIAVWSPTDKAAGIYWTTDTAVVELFGYACIGSGGPLAHYTIRPQHKSDMTEAEVRPMAIDALKKAKQYVDGVGGFTDLATLKMSNGNVSQIERIGLPV